MKIFHDTSTCHAYFKWQSNTHILHTLAIASTFFVLNFFLFLLFLFKWRLTFRSYSMSSHPYPFNGLAVEKSMEKKKSLCEAVVMCTRHENCKQKTYTFTQITNLCATSLEVKGTLQPSQNSIMKKWIWIFQVYVVSTCLPACCFMSIANLFMYLLYPTTTTTTTSRDGTWNEPLLEFIKIKSFFFPSRPQTTTFFPYFPSKTWTGRRKKKKKKEKVFPSLLTREIGSWDLTPFRDLSLKVKVD